MRRSHRLATLLVALSASLTLGLTGCGSGTGGAPGSSSSLDQDLALRLVDQQEFPLCAWVQLAITDYGVEPGLMLMLQPTYLGDDPVRSDPLSFGGSEEYVAEGEQTKIICRLNASIPDVTSTVVISLSVEKGAFSPIIERAALTDHNGRYLAKSDWGTVVAVASDSFKIKVTLGYAAAEVGVEKTNIDNVALPLLEGLLNTWDNGELQKKIEGAAK